VQQKSLDTKTRNVSKRAQSAEKKKKNNYYAEGAKAWASMNNNDASMHWCQLQTFAGGLPRETSMETDKGREQKKQTVKRKTVREQRRDGQ